MDWLAFYTGRKKCSQSFTADETGRILVLVSRLHAVLNLLTYNNAFKTIAMKRIHFNLLLNGSFVSLFCRLIGQTEGLEKPSVSIS